jgi:O-antigen/teichoic acid export membrane protein
MVCVKILSGRISRMMEMGVVQRQSIISLAQMLSTTLFGFFSTIYFAHTLGPGVLGAFFLFMAYFGIFDIVGDGGMGGAAVKRISEGKEQNEFFSAYLLLRVILVVGAVALLLLAQPYLTDLNISGLTGWLIAGIIVSSLFSSILTGVYGRGHVGIYQISHLFNLITKVLVQVTAVFLGFQLGGLITGVLVGMFVGAIISIRFLDVHIAPFKVWHLKSLFSFSFWIFLSASGAIIFSYADTIMIGYFMSEADVGIYRTAFQLTSAGTFITLALVSVLFPKISGWHTEGQIPFIENALARAFSYSLLLAVPVAVGGWILGDSLLYYLYGAPFATGATALALLLAVQIVNVFMHLQIMTVNAMNQPRKSFQITAGASIANIVINLLLIPILGIVGAAIATLATMSMNAFLAYFVLSKHIHVKIERSAIFNIWLASLIMALFLAFYRYFVPLNNVFVVFIAVVLGGTIYGLIVLKIDKGIYKEIREILAHMGAPWPRWLDKYYQ